MSALQQFLAGRPPKVSNPTPTLWPAVDPVYFLLPNETPVSPEVQAVWPYVLRCRRALSGGSRGEQQALEALVFEVIEVTGADDPALATLRREIHAHRSTTASRAELEQAGWFADHPLLAGALGAVANGWYNSVVQMFLLDLAVALLEAGQTGPEIGARIARHFCAARHPEVTAKITEGMIAEATRWVKTAAGATFDPEDFDRRHVGEDIRRWVLRLKREVESRAAQPIASAYYAAFLDAPDRHVLEQSAPQAFGKLLVNEALGGLATWSTHHAPLPFAVPAARLPTWTRAFVMPPLLPRGILSAAATLALREGVGGAAS